MSVIVPQVTFGDHNALVSMLQEGLSQIPNNDNEPYYTGTENGSYGTATAAAVTAFQEAFGITVPNPSHCGDLTWQAVFASAQATPE